jgi:membrane fusion protein, multidrug efflux system
MRKPEALLLIGLLLHASGCGHEDEVLHRETVVRTAVIDRGVITRTTVVPCRLEGGDDAVLSVSTPASVTGVFVIEGDRVEDGDLLVSLETDGMHDAEIAIAAARVSAARAAHEYTAGNLDRMESLFEAGAASVSGYEAADAAEISASATERLAEAGYSQALSEASLGQVRAPFSGTVTRVWARQGNPAGGSLVALTGGNVLEASLQLPPCSLRDLEPGLPVFLESPVFPGELFEGTLIAVSPSVDPVSGLVSARAQFANPENRLRSGMGCTATVALQTEAQAIVIPQSAMKRTESGWQVAVVEDGVARFQAIQVGIQNGFQWEVLSGLSEGDRLILLGVNTVTEGDRVREASR